MNTEHTFRLSQYRSVFSFFVLPKFSKRFVAVGERFIFYFFSHSSDARSVVKSSYVCVFVFEIEFEIILIQENRRCAMVVNCDKFVAKNHNVLDEINDFDSESDCDGR